MNIIYFWPIKQGSVIMQLVHALLSKQLICFSEKFKRISYSILVGGVIRKNSKEQYKGYDSE
jgi:hypothetical protein